MPFTGSPQPKVTWTYNNGRLPDPRRTTDETIYNMTALTISRAKRSDAGNYMLTLANSSGKDSLTVKVNVIGKYPPSTGGHIIFLIEAKMAAWQTYWILPHLER